MVVRSPTPNIVFSGFETATTILVMVDAALCRTVLASPLAQGVPGGLSLSVECTALAPGPWREHA